MIVRNVRLNGVGQVVILTDGGNANTRRFPNHVPNWMLLPPLADAMRAHFRRPSNDESEPISPFQTPKSR